MILLLVCSSMAHGRIGETLEECRKRYGKETETKNGAVLFTKAEVWVVVVFWKDKVHRIGFMVASDEGKGKALSVVQRDALLEANRPSDGKGNKVKWERSWDGLDALHARWRTVDKSMCAEYADNALIVITKKFKDHLVILEEAKKKKNATEKATKEKEALKDF